MCSGKIYYELLERREEAGLQNAAILRMEQIYPYVPLADNLGLGIALFSYNGEVAWGLNADRDVVPDVSALSEQIESAFSKLRKEARRAAGVKKPGKKNKKSGSKKS